MLAVAFKMLIGNRASFIGAIFGVFLATLLISQQSAIFLGLVSRSYRMVTDISLPNIWVIDPATQGEGAIRTMPKEYLDIVRSTPGIEWAVPIDLMDIPIAMESGVFKIAQLYGIDDATLIGAPAEMLEGNVRDLHREGAVIIDVNSANGALAHTLPDGSVIPVRIGDTFEINNRRAVVVGIAKITPGFFPQPVMFTATSQFEQFTSVKRISFIAAKSSPDANVDDVLNRINSFAMYDGLTSDQFKRKIAEYFLKTGILINFGLSVALGLIIGFSITGQIFYILTLQNINYYALMKALGGNKTMILKMIILQAVVSGVIGYLIGTAATLLWGFAIKNTTLAFLFPWQLLLFTASVALIICIFTAILSIRRVLYVDPKTLLGS
ncbi:ABC transporter permease [Parachlamydia acanthamoebae]|uniref:Uncharacterized protein n=2 Tax=Parachlamydia acanthamoebae TaxID=83552 RepID=F8KVD9_PARAV|nr:ABC transporter permease [Parachlamydia acanthamoebae]KIA76577.1 hypothetical protein DB43_AA00020 [Parachlamydia acanthamoebae]CCB87664.1 putative uncharacterized protein [Parachlamydia acanthamoebae UV-7]